MSRTLLILIILVCLGHLSNAQDKRGYAFVLGGGGTIAQFMGDTTRPTVRQLYPQPQTSQDQIFFTNGSSNICDSVTGNILMLSNGYVVYDTLGNIMDNGDSLVPPKIYSHNAYPNAPYTQGSLILPKGSNGLYYLFTNTITDSMYDYWNSNPFGDGRFPFDLLQYHIVDMNANGGAGKVIQKNIELLSKIELNKSGMMACKHANGYDWWLLKQGANTNDIYTFLVTADTVVLDTIQRFPLVYGYYDLAGQSCFSNDGTKYAFASGGGFANTNGAKLFISNFDRCTGIISNIKNVYPPYDSTGVTILDSLWAGSFDSLITGLAFSPNDSFLYVNRRYNVYQYEINEPDTSLAWYRLKNGPDTSFQKFEHYAQMQLGADGRIYIGKWGGFNSHQNSVIDYPNRKGGASGFCRKCLRADTANYEVCSPSNLPNFNLGALSPCWPLSNGEPFSELRVTDLEVYPNPAHGILYIKTSSKAVRELYNGVGQVLLKTYDNELDLSGLSRGVYYLRVGFETKKVLIE